MFNDAKATVNPGSRVRLLDINVTKESVGKTGVVVSPQNEFQEFALRDNPQFNLVKLDEDGRIIFMMDVQLEILDEPFAPPAGSWADVARILAEHDETGFDWDAWKDEMKDGEL